MKKAGKKGTRKKATKKTAARKPPAKKTVAKKKSTSAKKVPTKKKSASRKQAVGRSAAKKATSKRAASKKTGAKKTRPRHKPGTTLSTPRRPTQEVPGARDVVRTSPQESPREMARSGLQAFDAGDIGRARRKLMELVEHFDGQGER